MFVAPVDDNLCLALMSKNISISASCVLADSGSVKETSPEKPPLAVGPGTFSGFERDSDGNGRAAIAEVRNLGGWPESKGEAKTWPSCVDVELGKENRVSGFLGIMPTPSCGKV